MNTKILMCVLILGLNFSGFCQVGTMTQISSNLSPDAASLGKYVEVPVSLYSGIPQISIPLYQLNTNGISVPISLSYHASGVKVNDIPGCVGLGFSLNAGGVITRIVRGYPDNYEPGDGRDAENYLLKSRIKSAADIGYGSEYSKVEKYYMTASAFGMYREEPYTTGIRHDLEYDHFYFNFLGNIGEFTFNNEGSPMLISGSNLKIEYTNRNFKITDANGIQFFFEDKEDSGEQIAGEFPPSFRRYTTSWFLSRIYSPISKSSVSFKYKSYRNSLLYTREALTAFSYFTVRLKYRDYTEVVGPGTANTSNPGDCPDESYLPGTSPIKDFTVSVFLDEITWDQDKKIKFYGDLTRTDLHKYKLDSIGITCGNEVFSKIGFQYSYFNDSSPSIRDRRLKLEKVSVNDQLYKFGYIESIHGMSLPSIDSDAQDIWGFYNGENENTGLKPDYKLYAQFPVYSSRGNLNSAIKNSDGRYAQIGTLSSITYPTGGKTLFTYEGNDYSAFPFIDPRYNIETDPYTQLKLGSILSKQCRADCPIGGTSVKSQASKNFVIHYDQNVTLNVDLGLDRSTTYAQYMNIAYTAFPFSYISLQRYNDETKEFDNIETFMIAPVDSIGSPTSEANYNNLKSKGNKKNTKIMYLTEGRYRMLCDAYGKGAYASSDLDEKFTFKSENGIYNAGGIRIKKIAFLSNNNIDSSYVKAYNYREGTISTGVLESPFSNIYRSVHYGLLKPLPNVPDYYRKSVCEFFAISEDPIIPLGNAKGGVIGYSKVIEKREDNSKIIYRFTSGTELEEPMVDEFLNSTALPTRIRILRDNSWKRGLEKQTDYYNSTNSLVKSNFKNYYFLSSPSEKSISLVLDNIYFSYDDSSAEPHFITQYHNHALIKTDSTVNYNSSGNLVNLTKYEYDISKHSYPRKISVQESNGSKTVTNLRYVQDYMVESPSNDTIAKSIALLKQYNFLSPIIEKYIQKADATGANLKTTMAELNIYKETEPLLHVSYGLETAGPLTNFSPLSVSASGSLKDSRYVKDTNFLSYYRGKPTLIANEGHSEVSYIWNEDGSGYLYEIKNAKGAETSFVNNNEQNFNRYGKFQSAVNFNYVELPGSPAGKYSLDINGQIGVMSANDLNLTPSKIYVFSYWGNNFTPTLYSQGGAVNIISNTIKETKGNWIRKEIVFNGVSGRIELHFNPSGYVQDFKLYPLDSHIQSCVYKPLVGIVNNTDPKGQVTYYEYDSFQRLKNIKDQNGNIVKSYDYHYKP